MAVVVHFAPGSVAARAPARLPPLKLVAPVGEAASEAAMSEPALPSPLPSLSPSAVSLATGDGSVARPLPQLPPLPSDAIAAPAGPLPLRVAPACDLAESGQTDGITGEADMQTGGSE